MAEHTPGPWTWEFHSAQVEAGDPPHNLYASELVNESLGRWVLTTIDKMIVPQPPFGPNDVREPFPCALVMTTEANARLIAVAPDLLEVVEKLYAAVIGHTGEVEDCDLCQLQVLAQAALEKARGVGRGTE